MPFINEVVTERVYIHRYTLRSRQALNAKSVRLEHQGALICVHGGYGGLHPWPELGDGTLDQQLELWTSGEGSPLIRAAMTCAQADGQARREGRSLFDGLTIPRSHATLPMDELAFEKAVAAGFDRVKVKMGRNLIEESEFLRHMTEVYPDLRWRLDFNNTQPISEVAKLIGSWEEGLVQKIDFLEDAYAVGDTVGPISHLRSIPLAVDRNVAHPPTDFPLWVLKPAVNEMPPLLSAAERLQKRVVVTSYMDHPLGQSYAAWQAALATEKFPDLIDVCGLITHGLFESDAFTEALGLPSPNFNAAVGTGLGFDDLLENLPWKRWT